MSQVLLALIILSALLAVAQVVCVTMLIRLGAEKAELQRQKLELLEQRLRDAQAWRDADRRLAIIRGGRT